MKNMTLQKLSLWALVLIAFGILSLTVFHAMFHFYVLGTLLVSFGIGLLAFVAINRTSQH